MECGCGMAQKGKAPWIKNEWQFCPLHKAAPELLETCERLCDSLSGALDILNEDDVSRDTEGFEKAEHNLRNARALIKKAVPDA